MSDVVLIRFVCLAVFLVNQSINQTVDFHSGLSDATTASTINGMMPVDDVRCDCMNKKRFEPI